MIIISVRVVVAAGVDVCVGCAMLLLQFMLFMSDGFVFGGVDCVVSCVAVITSVVVFVV